MWGFEQEEPDTFRFYTRSAERPNNAVVDFFEGTRQATWHRMMDGMTEQLTAQGIDVGPRIGGSFSEPSLPPCYLPPPGRTAPPAEPLPSYSGTEVHFLLQYQPTVFADPIERRFTIYPGITGQYFPRDVLVPPGSAYVVFGYDPGTDRWGMVEGEAG